MTRFEKYVGKGSELVIGEDRFVIKPLGTDEMPLFLKVMKAADEKGGLNLEKFTDEQINALKTLLDRSLEVSFPEEWKTNKEEVKQFGMKYMMELLMTTIEANQPEADKRSQRVEELKQRMKPQ